MLLATTVFADSGSQSSPPPVSGCGGLILLYICSKRKEQEIGGWLLYYYIQLYLGLFVTVAMFAASFDNYRPDSWSGAPELYPWFLASTLPLLLLTPAELVVAEKLRRSRDPRFLKWLRAVLWAGLAVALLGGAIDMAKFPSNLLLDVIPLVWPLIWLPYFHRSTRVKKVFITKDWFVPWAAMPGGLGLR